MEAKEGRRTSELNRVCSSPQAYNDEEWDGKWEDESVLLGGNAKEGVDRKAFTLLCAIARARARPCECWSRLGQGVQQRTSALALARR